MQLYITNTKKGDCIMSRKPIIAGNWKMNLLQSDAKALLNFQQL